MFVLQHEMIFFLERQYDETTLNGGVSQSRKESMYHFTFLVVLLFAMRCVLLSLLLHVSLCAANSVNSKCIYANSLFSVYIPQS